MTGSTSRHAAARVHDVLESVFGSLDGLCEQARQVFGSPVTTAEDLHALDGLAQTALARSDGLIVGAGFVAAAGALDDSEYWLQWWSDYENPRTWEPRALVVQLDPRSENFNDYTTLPWFKAPRADGRRHITGPYVDFLCTDEYTLTFTVPIVGADGFAGVVGADVYARVMESVISPLLTEIGEPAALLNGSGRVVTASRSTMSTGDMVRDPDITAVLANSPTGAAPSSGEPRRHAAGDHQVWLCADLGMAVVTGPVVAG